MKRLIIAACAVLAITGLLAAPAQAQAKTVNVALITGGHGFDEPAFLGMLGSLKGVTFTHMPQKDECEFLDNITDWPYDVIVLYNMTQKVTPERQKNFLALLDRGVGVVVLHHAMVAFQEWPEFEKICGCRYFRAAEEKDGKAWPKSTFIHDVTAAITPTDVKHPITRGIEPFDIVDETYHGCWFAPDNKVLLRSNAESSDGPIAYVRSYGNARVCTLQLGHDAKAYANPSFQKVLTQAIKWTKGKEAK